MNFLRRRRSEVERAWVSDRYSAEDRSRALNVLAGCVVLVRHPYQRDPHSGAGNCWCGRDPSSSLHHVVEASDG